jgi:imidazolonepropionase-like amidohydrolase
MSPVLVKSGHFAILAPFRKRSDSVKSVFAETLYTGDEVVRNVHLVFEGNQVKGVSKEVKGDFLGKFPVVTPAFIDAHSHIGMERAGEPGSEGEANDRMD